jgi:hypothetical protein
MCPDTAPVATRSRIAGRFRPVIVARVGIKMPWQAAQWSPWRDSGSSLGEVCNRIAANRGNCVCKQAREAVERGSRDASVRSALGERENPVNMETQTLGWRSRRSLPRGPGY